MTHIDPKADWIAVEWAADRIQAWLLSADGAVRAHAANAVSGGTLDEQLQGLIEAWLPPTGKVDVLCAGGLAVSVSGRPRVPCACADGLQVQAVSGADERLNLFALSGISQAEPLDVLEAQAAQVAGYIAQHPKFDGVICLAGPHTKWVRISAEETVSFESYMTGEMLALLADTSQLEPIQIEADAACTAAFDQAVDDVRSKPEKLAARLYGVQAERALGQSQDDTLYARLSGLLIGAEITAARPYWLGQDVVLLGRHALEAPYLRALTQQGAMVRSADVTDAGLLGLALARKKLLHSSA